MTTDHDCLRIKANVVKIDVDSLGKQRNAFHTGVEPTSQIVGNGESFLIGSERGDGRSLPR